MPQTTKIVRASYSAANIQVDIKASAPLSGARVTPFGIAAWNSIEYSTKLDRSKWWGAEQNPVMRSEPRADYEASIEMPVYWWRYIIDKASSTGMPLAELEMTLTVSYRKRPLTAESVDTLYQCAIKEMGASHKDGTDNSMVTIPLDPMRIFYNGKDVFGNTLSSAI